MRASRLSKFDLDQARAACAAGKDASQPLSPARFKALADFISVRARLLGLEPLADSAAAPVWGEAARLWREADDLAEVNVGKLQQLWLDAPRAGVPRQR